MQHNDVTAIIPLKALAQAKSRLSGDLGLAARRRLVGWMFAQVVDACVASRSIGDIVVVAGDEDAASLAASHGVRVLAEPAPGLNPALAAATATVDPTATSLVVAADLPLARGADLDRVCAAAGGDGAVVAVVATRDGGTAVLLRRPAAVIATAYGPGSAAAHVALARRAGVPAQRLDIPALALDVDTGRQLTEAAARGARAPVAIPRR